MEDRADIDLEHIYPRHEVALDFGKSEDWIYRQSVKHNIKGRLKRYKGKEVRFFNREEKEQLRALAFAPVAPLDKDVILFFNSAGNNTINAICTEMNLPYSVVNRIVNTYLVSENKDRYITYESKMNDPKNIL